MTDDDLLEAACADVGGADLVFAARLRFARAMTMLSREPEIIDLSTPLARFHAPNTMTTLRAAREIGIIGPLPE